METLIEQFESFAEVASASDKKPIVMKIADITTTLLQNLRRADYVLIDVFSTKAFYFALWAAWLSWLYNRKYILNLHGGNLPTRYMKNKKWFHYMLSKAQIITAPSGYLHDYFCNLGYKVLLIPNPIHVKDYPVVHNQTDVPSILYLRGYGKIYRPELVIFSMQKITQKYPNAHLYMYGNDLDNGMEKCIDLVHALSLQQNITINGPKPKSDWLNTAKNCNIFLSVPSIDNTPVSALEAMAIGLPVITTNVGGIGWMIKNEFNGLYTQPIADDIAQNVFKLIEDKDLYHKIQNNGLKYVKEYEIEKVTADWKDILLSP
jgi:glycosyltransferase involved in cell wall biosynthesis